MAEKFNQIIEYLKGRTDEFSFLGIMNFILDIILVIAILLVLVKAFKLKLKPLKVTIILLSLIFLINVAYFLDLKITWEFLKILGFWSIGILIVVYNQEIKHVLEIGFHNTSSKESFATEEEKLAVIKSIVNGAGYLSERKIGALITIERNDNLDSLIDKAIVIRGKISEELLTSLFYVGTVTHDGAVIIRKNQIMCAGAYLPSTDKYDVPKALGTRHRAAIGLSERYDAITVVVSEETGRISLTIDGIIQQNLDRDHLNELLSQYLMVK